MSGFYILSVKWTKRSDGLITWWGPNDNGYRYRLEESGVYTQEQIDAMPHYYHNGTDTIAAPVDVVAALAVPVGSTRAWGVDWDRGVTDRVVLFKHFAALKKAHKPKRKRDPVNP